MRSFLAKHQYLVIWVSGLVIVGALTVLVIQLNGSFLATMSPSGEPTPLPLAPAPEPAATPTPSVTLTIQKAGTGSTLLLKWLNLPNGTTELYIFRGKENVTSSWQLWKTLRLGQGQLGSGNAQFVLGAKDLGYEYFVQAVSGGGGSGDGSSSSTVLWQSGTGDPGSGGSGSGGGTGNGGGGSNGGGGGNGSSTQGSGSGNSSSSNGGNGGGSGNGGGGGNSSGTSGNPYYNPQIQITGYGTANGSFWVQHVNQSIEIGWQNLPPSIDTIVVSRTQDQNSPWNQILTQKNPSPSGSYSLQLVDGTLGDPYYYEMTALTGSTTIGTYGPIYLPPSGQ